MQVSSLKFSAPALPPPPFSVKRAPPNYFQIGHLLSLDENCPSQRRQHCRLHLMPKHHPNAGCLEGFNKLFLARPSTNVAFRKQHITFIAPHLPQDRRIVIPDRRLNLDLDFVKAKIRKYPALSPNASLTDVRRGVGVRILIFRQLGSGANRA